MIVIDDIEQGSPEWHKIRLAVVTASRSHDFSAESKLSPLPKDAKHEKILKDNIYTYQGKEFRDTNKTVAQTLLRESLPLIYPESRQGYLCELVAQACTGLIPEEMSFKQCEWGKKHEDEARAHFEIKNDVDVTVPSFIYKDKLKRFGISPDGLVNNKKIGLEIKCPYTSKVHVEFVTCDKIKSEYIEQCQFSMWVTGYDGWYFASYDPRIKSNFLHSRLIERDQSFMDKYDKASESFISDMDLMLSKMNVKFGNQWQ